MRSTPRAGGDELGYCRVLMNKQVAGEIGVSEITVKIHRGHAMRKMGARSLTELVRRAKILGISRA